MPIDLAQLGFAVNMYDSRKGCVATSSLEEWQKAGDPPAPAVVPEPEGPARGSPSQGPLLAHAPYGEQGEPMRVIARRISG